MVALLERLAESGLQDIYCSRSCNMQRYYIGVDESRSRCRAGRKDGAQKTRTRGGAALFMDGMRVVQINSRPLCQVEDMSRLWRGALLRAPMPEEVRSHLSLPMNPPTENVAATGRREGTGSSVEDSNENVEILRLLSTANITSNTFLLLHSKSDVLVECEATHRWQIQQCEEQDKER